MTGNTPGLMRQAWQWLPVRRRPKRKVGAVLLTFFCGRGRRD